MAEWSDYIGFNDDFKDSVNLYLDLNRVEKVRAYIPTKSSVAVLEQYLDSVLENKQQATLLVGPYGKGKSHLLLLLISLLSLDRKKKENMMLFDELSKKVSTVDPKVGRKLSQCTKMDPFLPVLITNTQTDLTQAFMIALNDALKREDLQDITPESYFGSALEVVIRWKKNYPEVYKRFESYIKDRGMTIKKFGEALARFEESALETFKEIYPELSGGSVFNPLIDSDVLPVYRSVSQKLLEKHHYSGLYIVFDEFSKYIESQNKQTVGNNMKLLQEVCELAADSKECKIHFTMVAHKSIKEYGNYLTNDIINSFTGIEGRLREVLFVTSSKNNYELISHAVQKKDNKLFQDKRIKPYVDSKALKENYGLSIFSSVYEKNDFEKDILFGCYPLSPCSAYLLLNVSESVAQNERTLFTFISKDEQYSVARYVKDAYGKSNVDWIVNADLIYDYFKTLFKKDINNVTNHTIWMNAEYALGKTADPKQRRVLKSLAIIQIAERNGDLLTNEEGLRLASGIGDLEGILKEMEESGLIYLRGSDHCYSFKSRATSALKSEIARRKELHGDRIDVSKVLADVSEIKYVLPKKYNDKYTMTRYLRYEFMNIRDFLGLADLEQINSGEEFCDGKVIALVSLDSKNREQRVRMKLKEDKNERIVVLYNEYPMLITDCLQEYAVLQEIREDKEFFKVEGNEVLQEEVPVIEEDLETQILNYIDECFGYGSHCKMLLFDSEEERVKTVRSLTEAADKICERAFPKAVSINNELINKESITTGPIKKARKTIIETLLTNAETEELQNGTGAEATIYRALFRWTGIEDEDYKDNVRDILDLFDRFIVRCGNKRHQVKELVDQLVMPPYGLRRGVIPIYLAYALSRRDEDIIIYFENKEEPVNTEMILNMCEEPENYYLFVSLESKEKDRYITELTNLFGTKVGIVRKDSRIAVVLDGMQKWYRALPQVTKNIRRDNPYWKKEELFASNYGEFRACMQSVEGNPYEILFITLPELFETGEDYKKLLDRIKKLKKMLDGFYDHIVKATIEITSKVFAEKGDEKGLYYRLTEWYRSLDDVVKNGIHSQKINDLVRTIAGLKTFDESEIAERMVYAVCDMYIETWNDDSINVYRETLSALKTEIESIGRAEDNNGKAELVFTGSTGEKIRKYYTPGGTTDRNSEILKNMISDALEDFSDMSASEKLAVLLEMIEKEIR